jgi:DNA-directed RNA polymerase subunit M
MEFCPNCGTRLIPRKAKTESTLELFCKKCGYKKQIGTALEPVVTKVIQHGPQQLVAVINKDVQLSTLPTINVECPRCQNNKAYVWQVQTRGADESSTQFMRCTNCNYTFREYS